MKWLIASDIHGSAYYCRKLLETYDLERADRMLLLGDILCVRGNCDGEVDQMVLEFPIMADYCVLAQNKGIIYATHGHHFNEQNLPPLHKGDILLHGHTHIPKCVEHEEYVYLNPGSVSIPKEDSWHGYMTLEEGMFRWKDLEGNEKHVYVANWEE